MRTDAIIVALLAVIALVVILVAFKVGAIG